MQIQSINIERFGRKQNVFVDGIADRLNVIYGANGSGKTTAIQFVRWMLYGNCDDSTGRYLADYPAAGRAAGTITFSEHGRRRSMSRVDDGSRYGQVALDGGGHYAKQANHLISLLGDVSQTDFDLLYAPDLDRKSGLSALLQSSLARGIDLTSQRVPSEKVQDLRLRIDGLRSEMNRLPFTSGELSTLLDRKRSIERKISEMEYETRRRKEECDREFQEVSRRVQDGELEIDRLRTEWHSRDEQVAARRRELEEAWKVADRARQEYLSRRQNELAEIDANVARARSMQAEVHARRERLEAKLRDTNISLERNPQELEETVCLVQKIAQQLDDIKAEDAHVADTVTPFRSVYRYHGTPPSTSTSIDALRTQVGRLCDSLQHERTEDRVRAMAIELDELRQTDNAMQRWVRGLVAQQGQVQRELDDAQRFGISLVVDRPGTITDGVASSYADAGVEELQLLDTMQTGHIRAVGHTCDGYEPVHPEQDPMLRQLTQQRDAAHQALQSAERQLRHLMERRIDLEKALSRLNQQDMEMARREMAEVESLIRAADERDRILREISQLEEEIARMRDSVRNSPVAQHATKIMRRLTNGRYRGLRIDNMRDVSVEDGMDSWVPVEHLSRGIRDQVYLSFCLAIITVYRQQGIDLPFLLNDSFANVDSEKDDTLAAVLREFADSGQQVLVFTRHQHVANMLRNLGARYLELNARSVQEPRRTTEVDHVRFRPQSEDGPSTFVSAPRRADYVVPPPVQPSPIRSNYVAPPIVPPAPTSAFQSTRPQTTRTTQRTTVWDDGVSEHRRSTANYVAPTQSVSQTMRTSAVGMPTQTGPFENVTFSNEQPIHSIAQSAPVARMPVPQKSFVQRGYPEGSLQMATQTHTQVPPLASETASVTATKMAPPTRRSTSGSINRSTSLEATGTVDATTASRLRAVGIVTVEDFLRTTPSAAEDQLRQWGLESRPIRRWQDQLTLRCDLEGVAADDARLLVACGACGIRDLAEADIDVLCERIGHLLSTQRTRNGGRRSLRPGSYPRERVASWIRSARSVWARTRDRNERDRSEQRNRRSQNTSMEMAPPYETEYDPDYVYNDPQRPRRGRDFDQSDIDRANARLNEDDSANYDDDGYYADESDRDRSSRSSRSSRSRSSSGRSRSSTATARSNRSSSARSTRSSSGSSSRSSSRSSSTRSPRTSRSSRSQSTRSRRSSRGERELRFYLDKSDPVVDAPTIGPKTAKKLHKIGIRTVDDLLKSNAAEIANALDDKRTDAATVTTWIEQAVLACRIPQLRGHDAQVLVACGISDPDTLAAMDPDDLWKIVRPFVKTSECKRIIRNGKAPDREEIGDWIEWAQSSRSLRAA